MIFSTRLSEEQKLVLMLSNPFSLDNAEKKKAESCIHDSKHIDIERMYRICVDNEVAGFVCKNSRDLEIFSEESKGRLNVIYKDTALRNMFCMKETLGILKVLSRHDIPAIPLKGTYVSDLVFEDFGVYPSSDIDLLIPPRHLFAAKDILCSECGYSPVEEISESDLLQNHYHLVLQRQMVVEIHWNLVKRYFNIPAEFWWESAQLVEWNKVRTMDLSIENSILYHVFRLFDHCFFPLRFFIMFSAIIEKNLDAIDWDRMLQTADDFGMKKLLVFTLLVTRDLLGTHIPDFLIREKPLGYSVCKYFVLSGIFSGVGRKHLRMMVYTLVLVPVKVSIKVFFQRVFPSKGELRLRYNLSPTSKRVYLFYILNPILLLSKSKRKKTNA